MECGDCTVCCTVLVVKELNKKAGEHCLHCSGTNCKIWGEHPQTCKEFECAYYQGGNNIELRPDKCGIMFYKRSDRIFIGVVVPDKEITPLAKGQIWSLHQQGYSVILMKLGEKPHIFLAEGHTSKEIEEEHKGLLNGNL